MSDILPVLSYQSRNIAWQPHHENFLFLPVSRFSFQSMLTKKGLFPGPLLSSNFYYLYTKIPLTVFKIKPEVIREVKILVYTIHFDDLLAYKSNGILNKTNGMT